MSAKALLTVLCTMALPVPALADCVTAADLKAGIAVTVKDKSVQTYRQKGSDVLATIPVLRGGDGFVAQQRLARGLFVVADQRTYHQAPPADGVMIVGGNDGGTRDDRFKWASGPKLPEPGQSSTARVDLRRDEDGPSIGPQDTLRVVVQAQVVTQAEKTVKISGCSYRIWPVETAFSVAPGGFGPDSEGGTVLTRRQIWFPDLGFGVTTKEVGSVSGWGEDWGQGIIAMAPAT